MTSEDILRYPIQDTQGLPLGQVIKIYCEARAELVCRLGPVELAALEAEIAKADEKVLAAKRGKQGFPA